MNKTSPGIPYGKQSISEQDIAEVCLILRSEWITQGPAIEQFEKAVAAYCGVSYAVAVSNGTAALHLACLAGDLKPGEWLWTSPNTFVASANCGLYCDAQVDFVDIDPRTYNMSLAALEQKFKKAEKAGTLPKIVIPVHFAGQSCEMEPIYQMGQKYGVCLVEDASHALGGNYKGTPIGSCQFSDMTIFSFHPVKLITTGEGGMITTNSRELYHKLIRLRSHGITRDPQFMEEATHGPWYYQQLELGYNYRITDIQAALGYSQFQRLDTFVKRRHELVVRYNQGLKDLPLRLPWQHPDTYSAFHLYVIRLQLEALSKSHRQVFEELRGAKIGVNLHYIPIHTQPYYQKLGFKQGDFPEAERYYQEAISLPLFYDLSDADQDYIIQTLKKLLIP